MKYVLLVATLMMGLAAEARPGGPFPRDPRGPHRPGPVPQQTVCVAQNRMGQTFRAMGFGPRDAGQRALNKCERNTRFFRCRIVTCHRAGPGRW